jgi:hypothetical protein
LSARWKSARASTQRQVQEPMLSSATGVAGRKEIGHI